MEYAAYMNGTSRRRLHRRHSMPHNSSDDPFASLSAQRIPTERELLGIPPNASPLAIIQGYQRALHSAQSPERRHAIIKAFSHLGPQAIRTACPWDHPLTLYALEGDSYFAHCPTCYADGHPSRHHYIGWAKCTRILQSKGEEMDPLQLPEGAIVVPVCDFEIHYIAPAGERALVFTSAKSADVRLHPGDIFSVIYRGDDPWRLLNHTSAESFPLDPHYAEREEIEAKRAELQQRTSYRFSV